MPSIAIIGAGCSGLAAAHLLQDAGHRVVLYEKEKQPGGRATTRKRDGFIFDYGAQYITYGGSEIDELVTVRFSDPGLIDIEKPVWIFDGKGKIQKGDPQQNAQPRRNYRQGLITLAQRMARGLSLHTNTFVSSLQQTPLGWILYGSDKKELGEYDCVIVAITATQAITLLQNSQGNMDEILRSRIIHLLLNVRYNPCISVALGYKPGPKTRPYYALVNTDKTHTISWLAWEHEKDIERVPAQTGLLIAQMNPSYSHSHLQDSDEEIYRDVAQKVSILLQEDLTTPMFWDVARWSEALPSQTIDCGLLNIETVSVRLGFCGDYGAGGRIYLALQQGQQLAQQLLMI